LPSSSWGFKLSLKVGNRGGNPAHKSNSMYWQWGKGRDHSAWKTHRI